MKKITDNTVQRFREYLINEEKSAATTEKYIHDLLAFKEWLQGGAPDKKAVLAYKEYLLERYSISSVNSKISSLNSFFTCNELYSLCIKTIKVQKQIFTKQERELTKEEYERLLQIAGQKKNEKLFLVMQTICSTGIRVSELPFITVEAVKNETAQINCKGKIRCVFLPKELCGILAEYIKEQGIESGSVFITKLGNPLNRSNIWADMKKLCIKAGIPREKVFPHNLRHLFARTYYTKQKDIVRLADILGHSSVNTTRIYTMEAV